MTDEKRTEPEQVKPVEVEQVKQQADVKQALKQTSTVKTEDTPKAETKDKLWLGTHFIILIALAAFRKNNSSLPLGICKNDGREAHRTRTG